MEIISSMASTVVELLPNLMRRYRVSTEIESIDEEAAMISLRGNFDRVSYLPARRGIGDRSVTDYGAFESRRHVLDEILEALKDNDVKLVGVYGMAGVGKTTIVKMVAEQVKANRIFDVVVLAVVSKTPDLKRIQGEIADGLGFEFQAETIRGRAERLRDRLERETKVLVILDDIWERLELDDVGIPSGSDNRGCKILMTSRDRNALYRGMDTEKLFHLKDLPWNEAWSLFKNKAGDAIKNPDLQRVAVEVAKRCSGLPLLLVTVASALKDGDLSEWKDALERLKRFDKEDIGKADRVLKDKDKAKKRRFMGLFPNLMTRYRKKTEWVVLITSVLLEAMSAVFEQVGYALMGMVISFLALFLSSLFLIRKARKGVERSQPSGALLDYYGLAAAVWQCFYSTMEYLYTRKNQQNPLKICLLPFMFALFVLLFILFKRRT